jgi:hypothetical protein
MTQLEIEGELKSLCEQLSQLREQQELRRNAWLPIGVWCWLFALLLFVLAGIVFSLGLWFHDSSVTPLASIIFLQIFPVIMLSRALWSERAIADAVPHRDGLRKTTC